MAIIAPSYHRWLGSLAIAGCFLATPARGFVYETRTEFFTAADLDGDGQPDMVVVDKPTGLYRVGYQLSPGAYTWTPARSCGMTNVTGFSASPRLRPGGPALAFAGTGANRVHVLDVHDPYQTARPVQVFPAGIGPAGVVAMDVGDPGAASLDGLVILSAENNAPNPVHLTLMRQGAAGFSHWLDQPWSASIVNLNAWPLSKGGVPALGLLSSENFTLALRVYSLATGQLVPAALSDGWPRNTRYAPGFFGGATLGNLLFYQAGHSNLTAQSLSVTASGQYQFSTGSTFAFAQSLSGVVVLDDPHSDRLLLLFDAGASAGVYTFDGVSAPVLAQSFTAEPGAVFTGALGDLNRLMLFSGPSGALASTRFQSFAWNAKQYQPVGAGSLPTLNPLQATANVFLFQYEPFVTADPVLLASLKAGDWSSHFSLSGSPAEAAASAESFGGPDAGLSAPTLTQLGPAHPLAHFGLVNQVAKPISLFSLAPASGDTVANVKITPEPGFYKGSISISLLASSNVTVFYHLDGASYWAAYSAPFPLFADHTVAYYAQPQGGAARSAIHRASYRFASSPASLDSDGDGVPDLVELAYGLDPTSGNDADGDGVFDLDEILAGTNPADPQSPGTNAIATLERKASFNLTLTPLPYDGTVKDSASSEAGTALRVYDLQGSLLGLGQTVHKMPLKTGATFAVVTNVVTPTSERFVAVATDPHYDLITPSPDKRLGRELLGLVPVPPAEPPVEIAYAYGGDDPQLEAQAWVAAARTAYTNRHRVSLSRTLAPLDTLAALLTERKLAGLLADRGAAPAGDFTLFPFRPNDAHRASVPQSLLLALESEPDAQHPAYRLRNILATLQGALKAAQSLGIQALYQLTLEIYGTSSALNNAAPGQYPLPVDVLRDFIASGVLHSNYLARTAFSSGQLARAKTGVAEILAAIAPRPTAWVTLQVRPDSFAANVPILDTVGGTTQTYLVDNQGQPFRFPEAFTLLTGSQLLVRGYTDLPDLTNGVAELEVISAQLVVVPAASDLDTDGNLLADDWELQFFGRWGNDPYGDADGDNYSNLEEMLAGSDPRDGQSHPASPPQQLTAPVVSIASHTGSSLKLSWHWPAGYADKVKFGVRTASDLNAPFTEESVAPTLLADGQMEITLPNPGAGNRFYLIYYIVK